MSELLEKYAANFAIDMRVGVRIPLPNAEIFSDWAVIQELDEDLVSLQLSRDQLPESLILEVGQILELRGGREGNAYSCRAIIVHESNVSNILLRLIGEIVSDELRQFYRIDAFLPIKYYIPREQHLETLQQEWEQRRQLRQENEINRRQLRWDGSLLADTADLPNERRQPPPADDEYSEWDTIIPLAANISGGGIRLLIHHTMSIGDYVLLEVLVPVTRCIVDVVARVVHISNPIHPGSDNDYCYTSMQFVFIDERQRDSIVSHISTIQLQRIKLLRESFIYREDARLTADTSFRSKRTRRIQQIVILLVVLSFITSIAVYFTNYASNRPKGEIEQIFEGGLLRYLERLR